MLYQIRKIKVLSFARTISIIGATVFLIPSVIFLITEFFDSYRNLSLLEMFMPILFPVIGAVGGFVAGIISGIIYNWVAEYWGGIEMEIEVVEEIKYSDKK